MVEPKHPQLSMRKQCEVLGLHRSTLYYEPAEANPEDLEIMNQIDRQYLRTPFYGSRRMTVVLQERGYEVNRKRVQRLMRRMGLEGLAPGPSTSRPHPEHTVYPYLLRGLVIDRPNQVWSADITYIPLRMGFAYLMALLDWFSRKVLAFRLCNTLDARFCVEALEEALDRYGRPEISNTDQGAQFTSTTYTSVLKRHEVQISMDGKGRCKDNIFVERLWRAVKYEEVYLHAYDSMSEAARGIERYFEFYNTVRPHQSLDYQRPNEVYFQRFRGGREPSEVSVSRAA
jgi:putative transposase